MKKYFFLLISICIFLSGCASKVNIEDMGKAPDFIEIYNETMEQQLADGSFSYWPDEVPEDIYSTYYSVEILKQLDCDYENPIYNLENLNQKITSLYDLYLFVSLFDEDINKSEEDKNVIIKLLEEYKINNYLYTIDETYIPTYLEKDDVVLMATVYAINIYELLGIEYQVEDLEVWSMKFFENSKLVENVIDRYDQLYLLICLTEQIGKNETMVLDEIKKNFEEYENELINYLDNQNFIFALYTYLSILEKTDLESIKIDKQMALQLLEQYCYETGGFAIDTYNPLSIFIMAKLISQYDIDIDNTETIRIVKLHKRIDNYYIPYMITQGDFMSTYYSLYVCSKAIENEERLEKADKNYSLIKNPNNAIYQLEDLIANFEPSYQAIDEIRVVLEYCQDNNLSLTGISMENILDDTKRYIEELGDEKEDKYRKFMAESLIALIDYNKIEDAAYHEIKEYKPSNIYESYHICLLLDNLKRAGIDISKYCNSGLIDKLKISLYETIGENGLFCTDNSKEAVNLSSVYMGMKVYETINSIKK